VGEPESNEAFFGVGSECKKRQAISGSFQEEKLTLSKKHRFLTYVGTVPTVYPERIMQGLERGCSLFWDFTMYLIFVVQNWLFWRKNEKNWYRSESTQG